jgi:hypothetical protein
MQAEIEVARLDTLKASKMKELVVKRRMELEEVCRCAHIEPDASTMEDKLIALIDSGDKDLLHLSKNIPLIFPLIASVECCCDANLLNIIGCRRGGPIRPSEQFGRADYSS